MRLTYSNRNGLMTLFPDSLISHLLSFIFNLDSVNAFNSIKDGELNISGFHVKIHQNLWFFGSKIDLQLQ